MDQPNNFDQIKNRQVIRKEFSYKFFQEKLEEQFLETVKSSVDQDHKECEMLIAASNEYKEYIHRNYHGVTVPGFEQLCSHLNSFHDITQKYQQALNTGRASMNELSMMQSALAENRQKLNSCQEQFLTDASPKYGLNLHVAGTNGRLLVGACPDTNRRSDRQLSLATTRGIEIVSLDAGWYESPAALLLIGVDGVVNMCQNGEFRYTESDMKKRNIAYHHEPTEDGTVPSNDQVDNTINWIREQSKEGKKIFVHCGRGQGRSVVIACDALIALEGINAWSAMDLVNSKRNSGGSTGFSPKQMLAVVNFEKRLNKQPDIKMAQLFQELNAHNDLKKSK